MQVYSKYFKSKEYEFNGIEVYKKDGGKKKIKQYLYKAPEEIVLRELLECEEVFIDFPELNSKEDPEIRDFIHARFDLFTEKYNGYLIRWLRRWAEKDCQEEYTQKEKERNKKR